jgi:hypothetical protein
MQQDAFFARGERFIVDGLRLRDVEVEEIDGTLFYSGLFRSGAGLNSITPPMRKAQFLRRQEIMLARGQELRDMERVGGGRANRFVGVWASGDDAAEITAPRSFGQQFALAQSQFNAGRRTLDFELQRIASPPGGDGDGRSVDPDAPPEMPTNQRHVGITDGNILRLQFTQVDDQPFTLELPRDALPDWLPHTNSGDPILPDAHCGLHIRRADSIFWQIPGDPEVTTPPFNAVPDVAALGDEAFLGGVHFAGPMGACTGSQKPWVFPSPFTSSGPFVPLPNMSLVVQLRQGAEIAFITDTGPEPKPLDVDKLFKDDSKKKLEEQVKFWNALLEEGEDISDYCPIIGAYWQQLCTQFPDKSEVCTAEVAALPDC